MNFEKLTDFMLTSKKLTNSICLEKNNPTFFNRINNKKKNENQKKDTNQNKDANIETNFFYPIEKDQLFWCFYIMINGLESYKNLENINIIIEKKIKIEYIELLRKNKQIFKIKKIAPLTHIENYLANENKIDIKTFFSLCILHNINVLYLYKNTYFLLNLFENENSEINFDSLHVIKRIDEPLKFGINNPEQTIGVEKYEKIQNYVNTYYKIENINKPIKALSSYKVSELTIIAKKLGIEILNNTTNKLKTKNEIYELLIQYF